MASALEIETRTHHGDVETDSRQKFSMAIVHTDPREARRMRDILRKVGHKVVFSPDYQVLPLIFENYLDALIIERGITEMGMDNAISTIRECVPSLPIVFVDSMYDENRCARVLEGGADDYLVQGKFSDRQLIARVEALVRRRNWTRDYTPEVRLNPIFKNGGLTINFLQGTVTLEGREIHLAPTEYKLLKALARNLGKTFLDEDLKREVWGDEGSSYNQRALRVNMGRLRHKLGENSFASHFIVTRSGYGYKMPDLNRKKEKPEISEDFLEQPVAVNEEDELTCLDLNPLSEAIEVLPQIAFDKDNKRIAIGGRVVKFGKVAWTVFTCVLYSREKGVSHSDIYEEVKRKVNSWTEGASHIANLRTKLEANRREPEVIIGLGEREHRRYYIRGRIMVSPPEIQSGIIFESKD